MGETPNDYDLPIWAPRVPKPLIARLYEGSGKGLLDDRLVDDVGYRLLLRCENMLDVGLRYEGRVRCPKCESISEIGEEDGPTCDQCGWKCSWEAYNKTIKHKKLHAGGMTPFLKDFTKRFPLAKTSSEKMILIDTLIHRYHWESSDGAGRPGSVGLIEGKMKDIMPFSVHHETVFTDATNHGGTATCGIANVSHTRSRKRCMSRFIRPKVNQR